MRTTNLVLALSLAALFGVTTVAGAAPILPNTGAGGGSTDANWSILWRGVGAGGTSFGSLADAPLVTSIPSPPWQPNQAGNNWIGVDSDATIAGAAGDGSHR